MVNSRQPVLKVSNHLLVGLVALEILLVLVYLVSIDVWGRPYLLFDFNAQWTIPSVLQALHFLGIGLIILGLLRRSRSLSVSAHSSATLPSRTFLITFAVLVFYAAVDELFKIHLKIHSVLPGQNWKWLYIGLFVTLMVWHYKSFVLFWIRYRRETLLLLTGIVIFVLGGYGSEILKDVLTQTSSYQTIGQATISGLPIENLRIAYEETSELVGETLILYACLQFVGSQPNPKL